MLAWADEGGRKLAAAPVAASVPWDCTLAGPESGMLAWD